MKMISALFDFIKKPLSEEQTKHQQSSSSQPTFDNLLLSLDSFLFSHKDNKNNIFAVQCLCSTPLAYDEILADLTTLGIYIHQVIIPVCLGGVNSVLMGNSLMDSSAPSSLSQIDVMMFTRKIVESLALDPLILGSLNTLILFDGEITSTDSFDTPPFYLGARLTKYMTTTISANGSANKSIWVAKIRLAWSLIFIDRRLNRAVNRITWEKVLWESISLFLASKLNSSIHSLDQVSSPSFVAISWRNQSADQALIVCASLRAALISHAEAADEHSSLSNKLLLSYGKALTMTAANNVHLSTLLYQGAKEAFLRALVVDPNLDKPLLQWLLAHTDKKIVVYLILELSPWEHDLCFDLAIEAGLLAEAIKHLHYPYTEEHHRLYEKLFVHPQFIDFIISAHYKFNPLLIKEFDAWLDLHGTFEQKVKYFKEQRPQSRARSLLERLKINSTPLQALMTTVDLDKLLILQEALVCLDELNQTGELCYFQSLKKLIDINATFPFTPLSWSRQQVFDEMVMQCLRNQSREQVFDLTWRWAIRDSCIDATPLIHLVIDHFYDDNDPIQPPMLQSLLHDLMWSTWKASLPPLHYYSLALFHMMSRVRELYGQHPASMSSETIPEWIEREGMCIDKQAWTRALLDALIQTKL